MISKRYIYLIIRILLISLIGYGFYWMIKPSNMNHFDFVNTVEVNNHTNYNIDTCLKVLINKMYYYDTLRVDIFYKNDSINYENNGKCYVIQIPVYKNYYLLIMDKNLTENELELELCHSMIHIDQYMKKELYMVDDSFFIYKDKEYDITKVNYFNRPFEQEAFHNEIQLRKKLMKILLK